MRGRFPCERRLYPVRSTANNDWDCGIISSILSSIKDEKFDKTALRLLSYLTNPRLTMKKHIQFVEQDKRLVDAEILMKGDRWGIEHAWKNIFSLNLNKYASSVLSIILPQFVQAHQMLISFHQADEKWDPISYSRSAIEPHTQNGHFSSFDILIDIIREIIDYYINTNTKIIDNMFAEWLEYNIPIIDRFVTYGIANHRLMKSDKKIDWVLNHFALLESHVHHELYMLLKNSYPNSSVKSRKKLLSRIKKDAITFWNDVDYDKEMIDQRIAYSEYRMYYWLSTADPTCQYVLNQLNNINNRYSFSDPDHPEFTHYMYSGRVSDDIEGIVEVEDIVKWTPMQLIHNLNEASKSQKISMHWQYDALMGKVTAAMLSDTLWTFKVADHLITNADFETNLWDSIFNSWRGSTLTNNYWEKALIILSQFTGIEKKVHIGRISDLLTECAYKEEGSIPDNLLYDFNIIAEKIIETFQVPSDILNADDIYINAINTIAGDIIYFWIKSLYRLQAKVRAEHRHIPDYYKIRFDELLTSDSDLSIVAKVIFAKEYRHLFYLDPHWVVNNIAPLFNWDISIDNAKLAWNGYLYGSWNEMLLPSLLIYYRQTFRYSKKYFNESIKNRFCEHIASIALLSSISPLSEGWLDSFIIESNLEYRVKFAEIISNYLSSNDLTEDQIINVSNTWIKSYWKRRVNSNPIPLDRNESREMLGWIIPLQYDYPEIVDLFCLSPAPNVEFYDRVFYKLDESGLIIKYPEKTAVLVKHILSGLSLYPFYDNIIENIYDRLLANNATKQSMYAICNELSRLGYNKATAFAEKLKSVTL
ncbi:MAG: hypothetical protein ACYDCO_08005 [Armatimonadota bacterium]